MGRAVRVTKVVKFSILRTLCSRSVGLSTCTQLSRRVALVAHYLPSYSRYEVGKVVICSVVTTRLCVELLLLTLGIL